MEYLKVFDRKRTLDIEDISYLSRLLKTNLSLNECFELLRNRKNESIFNAIRKKLSEGEMIEKIFVEYVPKELRPYLESLLGHLSFSQALSLTLEFHDKNIKSSSSLTSAVAYPCFLLFVTITALYLFDLYGLDSLFSLMGTFSSEVNIYQGIRMIFRIAINIIYYGFLIIVLLFIYLRQPKRIVLLYIFMSRYFTNSLFSLYYCEQFMSALLICSRCGFKTRESMEILKNMKSRPVISFLAFHLDDGLLSGQTLRQAAQKKYYDSSLARYIKMANLTNDFVNTIGSYIEVTGEKIERKMKRYALVIQVSTYAFIGAVIIFIYQLLFMPMQAITLY